MIFYAIIFAVFVSINSASEIEQLKMCSYKLSHIIRNDISENEHIIDFYAQMFKRYDFCMVEMDVTDSAGKIFIKKLQNTMNSKSDTATEPESQDCHDCANGINDEPYWALSLRPAVNGQFDHQFIFIMDMGKVQLEAIHLFDHQGEPEGVVMTVVKKFIKMLGKKETTKYPRPPIIALKLSSPDFAIQQYAVIAVHNDIEHINMDPNILKKVYNTVKKEFKINEAIFMGSFTKKFNKQAKWIANHEMGKDHPESSYHRVFVMGREMVARSKPGQFYNILQNEMNPFDNQNIPVEFEIKGGKREKTKKT